MKVYTYTIRRVPHWNVGIIGEALGTVMKILVRMLELALVELVEFDEMQFGFRKGKGTTHSIFEVKQMYENNLEKQGTCSSMFFFSADHV